MKETSQSETVDAGAELESLVRAEDWDATRALLDGLSEADRLHAASHLSADDLAHVLEGGDREAAAYLLELLPMPQAAAALESLEPQDAAQILEELPSDERCDLLGLVGDEEAQAILSESAPESADQTRALLEYPADSAGGLMMAERFTVSESALAQDVIDEIREHPLFADYVVQYIYVVGDGDRLAGVLQLRALLLAPAGRPVKDMMIPNPIAVDVGTSLEGLEDLFASHGFLGVPVVDAAGTLLGVVHRSAVESAAASRAQADTMKALGIAGGEELRSMPLVLRSRRRLSWLSVNIGLNVLAASVIAAYQETLQAVIALAVFLPMISDMSGCSGNQAVAVSLRELSLGVLRPNELWNVWVKEVALGLINGLVLGALIGGVAFLWQGNAALGLVVGGALAVNTVVAVSIGGTIPLLIRRLGQDPALASGPVLTTVTDMCGFFFALSFATLALDRLV